jgi:D-alanine-D-alanine ligase
MGGVGSERDISISSGTNVERALAAAGFDARAEDITPGRLDVLDEGHADVFFVAMHGVFGEDGTLQRILEDKSLVYTGSGPAASRAAFDKLATKRLLNGAGIDTAPAVEFDPGRDRPRLLREIERLGRRFVVKPARQGSSVGVILTESPNGALEAAARTRSEFGDCMIEQFIDGREVTVGILAGKALPIVEIRSETGFYDYSAKYADERTRYLFDTVTDDAEAAAVRNAALQCYEVLGLRHFARIDLILGKDGSPRVLEANSIPGLTGHSLLPKAAARVNIPMSELCAAVVRAALEDADARAAAG